MTPSQFLRMLNSRNQALRKIEKGFQALLQNATSSPGLDFDFLDSKITPLYRSLELLEAHLNRQKQGLRSSSLSKVEADDANQLLIEHKHLVANLLTLYKQVLTRLEIEETQVLSSLYQTQHKKEVMGRYKSFESQLSGEGIDQTL